jgi:hypothetical protein
MSAHLSPDLRQQPAATIKSDSSWRIGRDVTKPATCITDKAASGCQGQDRLDSALMHLESIVTFEPQRATYTKFFPFHISSQQFSRSSETGLMQISL